MTDPDLSPEPGWLVEPRRDQSRRSRSFVSGDPEGDRIRIAYYRHPESGDRVGKVWFGPGAEGPPSHAHGGAVAAVLDEAMGTNAWLRGHAVLAGTLTIRYRAPTPLERVFTVHTRLASVEGRRILATSTLVGPDGTVHAEGEGIFVVMRPEQRAWVAEEAARLGRPTPDAY
ncbi:MAG: PaaI family thioesterase [Alphaproteobacteria bacterium]|nr:PaaI family thioesterase [Alphaproteobacteria bacterium]